MLQRIIQVMYLVLEVHVFDFFSPPNYSRGSNSPTKGIKKMRLILLARKIDRFPRNRLDYGIRIS